MKSVLLLPQPLYIILWMLIAGHIHVLKQELYTQAQKLMKMSGSSIRLYVKGAPYFIVTYKGVPSRWEQAFLLRTKKFSWDIMF